MDEIGQHAVSYSESVETFKQFLDDDGFPEYCVLIRGPMKLQFVRGFLSWYEAEIDAFLKHILTRDEIMLCH